MIITIHDAITGETIVREMTQDELDDYQNTISTMPTFEENPTE